ncbi:ATP-binding protein [Coprobacter sp.]
MPQDMYDERIRAHQPQLYAWERLAADGVILAGLNENLIRNCIRRGIDGGHIPESALYEPTGDILSKWKLLKNGVPTNGAVLLFSNNIDEYPQFTLRMARFVGTNKNIFRDNQRAEGNFFQLLDAGVAFCFKHLSLSGRITNHSLEREEHLEVPYHALCEALINALCHRHWERHNLTISLAIYNDRIEIASPGTFPPQITPENIKEPHESYPHNLKVAEALYRMTYLENWGSGARRIMDACQAQGVETPTWSSDGGFVTITFKRPDFKSDIIENDKEDKKITEEGKYPISTPQVELLIQKMEDSYMTMRNMADVCDIKDLKYFRESYITPALEEGLIERLYPNQPKHPKQQYRLTEMAKEWLTNNVK